MTDQMIDQKNMTVINKFFEIIKAIIIIKEENVTRRDVTRDVIRDVI